MSHEISSLLPVPESSLLNHMAMSKAYTRAQILSATGEALLADEEVDGNSLPSPLARLFEVQHLSAEGSARG